MDLLRQMALNREAKGITGAPSKAAPAGKPTLAVIPEAPKTFSERRREIIANKPKAKVVRKQFEDLVEFMAESDSDSDF